MAQTHELNIPPAMIQPGFWLYVLKINTPKGKMLYVGRTGDSSSTNAASPFQRTAQHLGKNEKSNALRKHLEGKKIKPEDCKELDLIAYGPIFPEQKDMDRHRVPRDKVAALEKKLACALCAGGYKVLNKVSSRKPLDEKLWEKVRDGFACHFPRIKQV